MKWSWRIGQIAGIDIFVHSTFLILLGWVALGQFLQRHSIAAAIAGLMFVIALFTIVVLHELGHALTAKRFGVKTRDIILLPIGGVARLERIPEEPRQELLIALAGPAVNVALAAVFFLLLIVTTGLAEVNHVALAGGRFLAQLMWVNIVLAVFNMLPAFPMDGGRVLRALMAMRMGYMQATHTAATIGQGMALLFGLFGLFFNPFLIFIALFVWIGAASEATMVDVKWMLAGIPASQIMIRNFHTLAPSDSLQKAIDYILAGIQHDFPVVEDEHVVGILSHADVLKALAQYGPQISVRDIMQKEFEVVTPTDMLDSVYTLLASHSDQALPVVQNGRVAGIVTTAILGEFLMMQNALRNNHSTYVKFV